MQATTTGRLGVYLWTEVEQFAQAFFDPKRKQSALHAYLKPAADRWQALEPDDAEQFRKDLGTFLRLYDFLSQIVPYNDPELEKLYAFGKNLMPRISEHTASSILELDSDVLLTHYRLQKLGESKLDLESGEAEKLKPVTEAGSSSTRSDEEKALKEIVERMNDLFAGDLTEADMVGYVTTVKGKLLENETLAEQAANNSPEQFELGDFKDAFEDAIVEGMDAHNNIAKQMLSDERIFTAMQSMMAAVVYKAFQQKEPPKPAASK